MPCPYAVDQGIMAGFQLNTDFRPRGDQPRAIAELVAGLQRGDRHQKAPTGFTEE